MVDLLVEVHFQVDEHFLEVVAVLLLTVYLFQQVLFQQDVLPLLFLETE